MADLQVTISATGAAELSTLFSSLEKVSTAASKLAGSGKALEELRKLMVGLGNSGSSLGNLNKALNSVVSELQALPTRMATVLQNVPAQMARTGRAAGEALGQGIEQGAAASVGQARRRITTEVDQVQRAVEAAIRQQTLAATRAAEGAYSTIGAQPRLIRPTLLKLKEQNATLLSEAEKEEAKLQTALQLLEEKAARRDRERTQARWDSYVRGTGALDGFKRGKAQERAAIVAEATAETERLQAALFALDQRAVQQDQARALRRWASWNRGTDAISRFKQAKAQERAELLAAAEQEAARLQAALQGMDLRSMQQDRERAQRRWDSYVRGAGAIEAFKRAEKLKTDAIIQAAQTEQARLEAAFDALARQAKRRVAAATASPDRGVWGYSDLRSGKFVPTPAAAGEIDPAKADKGTNALLRQKAAIDAYIPTANTGHSAARGLASGFGLLWLTWGNLLPLLTTAAASNGFVAMAKAGADVQHTLTMIAALSGASATEVAGLNEQMHSLAKNGIFGPRDVAEALKVLTQAGLTAKEASANLGATLNFSVAGMVPIQQAAETLVTVTTAFNMGAAGFSVAGDVIAKTAAISKTSVEGMSGAFKTASVLNAQYGVTLTDVGVGLAALANLGIEASAAGTALRNMYADLSGRSTKVSVILKEQGIQLRDLATGKFPDVIKVVRELNEVLSKKTPIGAQNLLQSLVGERGGKPLVEMLELFRKAPKDLSSGFSNALEEMQAEVRNAYGTAAQVAIAANTSVKNQYASLIASFQSDLVRVFEENEPRMLSAIASIKKSLMDGGELQAVLSFFLGIMSRIVQVVVENAKMFGLALAVWAASRSALALLSVVSAKLAADTAAVATAQAAQAATTAAVGSAAAIAAGPLAFLGKVLSGINIVIGVGAALWTAYQLAKSSAQSAKESAGQFNFEETMKGLKKENETLEKELVLLRQGKTEAEAQKALAIADVYQKAAEGLSQKRLGLEKKLSDLVNLPATATSGESALVRNSRRAAEDGLRAQITLAREEEERNLQGMRDQQAILKANSQAKAELIELNSRRVPIGNPDGVDFNVGKPGGAGGGKAEQFANYTADLLRVQKDGHAKRMADLQQQTTFEKQLLDAKHRALLTSDADYQAESLAQTLEDEQRRLTEVSNFRATAMADLDSKLASVKRDAGSTNIAEASKAEGDAYTKLSPHIQNLVGHYKRLLDARLALDTQVDTDRSKITREAEQRRRLNEVDLAGRIRAEGKAYSDTAREMGVSLAAQEKTLRVEEQAAEMNEVILAGQKARLAFEQEFAPQLAKRVEALGQWEAAEASLGAQLDEALLTHEADSTVVTELSLSYYGVKAAVAQFRTELEKLRGVQSQGAGVAQVTAEVAQARKETLKMRDDLAEGLSKAVLSGGKGFKDHWKSLRDWLKDLFAKTVLTPVFKQVVSGAMGSSGLGGFFQSVGGSAAGNGLGSMLGSVVGTSIFGSSAAYGAALGTTSIGAGSQAAMLAAQTGEFGLAGLSATAGSAGGAAASLMAAAPYIAAAAAVAIALSKKSTPHVGGYALADATGSVTDITKQQGGKQQAETQTAVATLSRSLALSFNSVATTFGKDAGVSIRAVFESDSNDPSWGLFHMIGKGATQQMAGSFDALGTLAADPAEGLKQFSTQAATAVRDALVVMDIPAWAKKSLNALGDAVDVDALSRVATELAAVQEAIKDFVSSLKAYGSAFTSISSLSVDALDSLAQMAGGLDQLGGSLSAYYEKFYTEEERRANTIAYLTDEFNKLGVMPTTMKDFRGVMDEAQGNLGTEEGRTKFSTLLKLSNDFASLFGDTADALGEALASLAQDRGTLEVDLLRAKGDTAEAARLERLADLAELTKGVAQAEWATVEAAYDLNAALRAQITLEEALTGLRNDGRSLQADVLSARGDEAGAQALRQVLALEQMTAGMNAVDAERVRLAYEHNEALRLEVATLQRLKDAMASLSQEGEGLQVDLLSAQGREQEAADLRRLNALRDLTRGMSEADAARVAAAYDYTEALRTEVAMLQRVKEALAGFAKEGAGLQADILSAKGQDQAAADLRRLTALQELTRGMSEADASRVTAAYDYTEALRVELAALLRVKEALANLSKEGEGLQADLLDAQGREQEAADLRRLNALRDLTRGMSEADAARVTAAYDYTAALRTEVAMLQRVKEALASFSKEGAGLQADILAAQGQDQAAADLRRLTALQDLTRGMSEADASRVAAAYDYTEALRGELAALLRVKEVLGGLSKETSGLEADLLEARGQKEAAAALRRQTELADLTRGMSEIDAERVRVAYDYNTSLREGIEALRLAAEHAAEVRNKLKDLLLEGGDLSVRLLKAQGNDAGAASLQRALDLAKLTEGMTAAEAALITKTYDANEVLRAQVEVQEEVAAKAREMRSAWQALSKTLMEEVTRIRRGAQKGDVGYAARQAEFDSLTAKANAGDLEAGQQLVSAGASLLEAAEGNAKTSFEYRLQEASVALSLEKTASSITSRWGSAEQDEADRAQSRLLLLRQLETAQESGEYLIKIQDGMWSAVDILAALNRTMATLPVAAPPAPIIAPPSTVSAPASTVVAPPSTTVSAPPPKVAPPSPVISAPAPTITPPTSPVAPPPASGGVSPAGPQQKEAWQTTGSTSTWVSSGGAVGTRPADASGLEDLVIQGKVSTFTASDAVAWVGSAIEQGDLRSVYDAAKAQGISMVSLDALMGWSPNTSADWAQANGLPRFAKGGDHFGGLRLVGELGPELEATGPARIHSSESLAKLLRTGPEGVPEESREAEGIRSNGSDAAAEVRALREDQRRQTAASVALQLRMTKLLERWEQGGIPETRAA